MLFRSEFTIFSGSANPTLTATIARELGSQVGACVVDRYPDGDVAVQFLDSVRRKEVFLVQPTSPPVNDHLVELLALADACRRSGASRVSAIVPPSSDADGRISGMANGNQSWRAWLPICCRSLVFATSSQWICTRHRSRASFMLPWTT